MQSRIRPSRRVFMAASAALPAAALPTLPLMYPKVAAVLDAYRAPMAALAGQVDLCERMLAAAGVVLTSEQAQDVARLGRAVRKYPDLSNFTGYREGEAASEIFHRFYERIVEIGSWANLLRISEPALPDDTIDRLQAIERDARKVWDRVWLPLDAIMREDLGRPPRSAEVAQKTSPLDDG